jgi:hypothetical protein
MKNEGHPHPYDLHRWEDDGGRPGPEEPPVKRGGGMLRLVAVLLILLALLGGGIGYATHVAVELLWLYVVLLIVGVVLGTISYRGPRDPLL